MNPLLDSHDKFASLGHLVSQRVASRGRFIEVFCGSLDVFFAVEPARSVLIDARKPYIAFYEAVQREPDAVFQEFTRLVDAGVDGQRFAEVRSTWNEKDFGVVFASKFLYLNKFSVMGSFYVDGSQSLRATFGRLGRVPTNVEFRDASRCLRSARLYTKDFSYILRGAKRGDVVYVELPDAGDDIINDFSRLRLARLLRKASERGVTVLVSCMDGEVVRLMYGSWAEFESFEGRTLVSAVGSFMDRRQMTLFG